MTTFICAPLQTVFDAARNADWHTQTTKHTREKIVAGRNEGLFELNDEVTFEATHLFVRQRLSARVVDMQPPHRFSDEMQSGAFKNLRHVHLFEDSENGTRMTDVLIWTSPLGWLGKAADRLFLVRYMTRFLQQRNRALKALVEAASSTR
ncbi:MAG TPA: SRPBCC family protein [Abditibacteriaceae bacterium]|nr:SRPBCC family protein [Abditibacteriaceae bacterium]